MLLNVNFFANRFSYRLNIDKNVIVVFVTDGVNIYPYTFVRLFVLQYLNKTRTKDAHERTRRINIQCLKQIYVHIN